MRGAGGPEPIRVNITLPLFQNDSKQTLPIFAWILHAFGWLLRLLSARLGFTNRGDADTFFQNLASEFRSPRPLATAGRRATIGRVTVARGVWRRQGWQGNVWRSVVGRLREGMKHDTAPTAQKTSADVLLENHSSQTGTFSAPGVLIEVRRKYHDDRQTCDSGIEPVTLRIAALALRAPDQEWLRRTNETSNRFPTQL